jgi:hypothetical protein
MSWVIECPHCKYYVEIIEINCAIFRHGTFKNTGQQINPHSSKSDCDRFVETNIIYGCGKPFRVVKNNEGILEAHICDYI